MSSIGGKIVSGAMWTAVETWGQQLMLFLVFVVLAHLLGPEAIGLATMALVAPIILAVPVTRGIPEAIIQRPDIDPEHLDSAFWLLAGVGAALSALVILLAGPIAYAFDQPVLEDLVRCTGLLVFIQSLAGVPIAILKRHLNFRILTLRTLCATIAGGAVGISLAIHGYGVWSLIWMQLAKCTVEFVVLLWGTAWRPRMYFSYARCKDLFGFAGPIVGFSLWQFVNDEMPKVILGAVIGPSAVGIYQLARRPLEVVTSAFLAPLTAMAMPAVARMQSDRAKIDQFFNSSIRVAVVVCFPAYMGLAAIAPEAVPLVFGDHWSEAVLAVQIIMLLGLVRTVDGIAGGTVLAIGRSDLIFKFNVVYSFMGAATMLAAAQIGLEAVIGAIVFCNAALVPPFLYYTRKLTGINVLRPLAILPRVAIATGLMMIAVNAWRVTGADLMLDPAVIVAGAVVIGGLVYGLVSVVLIRPDLLAARAMLLKARG
jgi:O-antigen/teichoic acid export membrane protein